MERLEELARLIHERNRIEASISKIIGRPAATGSIGEYIASRIFGIRLSPSATEKAVDGYFTEGTLKGRTVLLSRTNRTEVGACIVARYDKTISDFECLSL